MLFPAAVAQLVAQLFKFDYFQQKNKFSGFGFWVSKLGLGKRAISLLGQEKVNEEEVHCIGNLKTKRKKSLLFNAVCFISYTTNISFSWRSFFIISINISTNSLPFDQRTYFQVLSSRGIIVGYRLTGCSMKWCLFEWRSFSARRSFH